MMSGSVVCSQRLDVGLPSEVKRATPGNGDVPTASGLESFHDFRAREAASSGGQDLAMIAESHCCQEMSVLIEPVAEVAGQYTISPGSPRICTPDACFGESRESANPRPRHRVRLGKSIEGDPGDCVGRRHPS